MRTRLIVQQQDYARVHELGAKWDDEKKEWYVENTTSKHLSKFMRWMPSSLKAPCTTGRLKKPEFQRPMTGIKAGKPRTLSESDRAKREAARLKKAEKNEARKAAKAAIAEQAQKDGKFLSKNKLNEMAKRQARKERAKEMAQEKREKKARRENLISSPYITPETTPV